MNETLTSSGVTYTYDKAGNMISANSGGTFTTYTYDFRNRLTEVTQGGTVTATYTYNASDQRIGVQEAGSRTWTVYNGTSADASPYADFNGSGTLLTRYLYGPGMIDGAVVDEIMARTSSGGTTAWYLPDKLGSVRDVVSSSGSELDHIVYDSFGNIVTETNAGNGDRFKFAVMQYDAISGQYYDHARDYTSSIGEFSTEDPTIFAGGNANLYGYMHDSPTDGTDRTGLFDDDPLPMPPVPSKTLPASDVPTPKSDPQLLQAGHDQPQSNQHPGVGHPGVGHPGGSSDKPGVGQPEVDKSAEPDPLTEVPGPVPSQRPSNPRLRIKRNQGTELADGTVISKDGRTIITPDGSVLVRGLFSRTWKFQRYIVPLPGRSNPGFPLQPPPAQVPKAATAPPDIVKLPEGTDPPIDHNN